MTSRRIVCTDQTGNTVHGHIIAVGIAVSGSDTASERLTVPQVYSAINRGDTFYTYGGGKVASVSPYRCWCGQDTLRSGPDATTANNLDSMRLCAWQAA